MKIRLYRLVNGGATFLVSIIFLLCLVVSEAFSQGQFIRGTVFKDLNLNGIQDKTGNNNETGHRGVIVRAYQSNAAIGSAITNENGDYEIRLINVMYGTSLRIEFTNYTPFFSSVMGTENGSPTQFISAGASRVNFAIQSPTAYCQPNPTLVASSYFSGKPLFANQIVLAGFPSKTPSDTAQASHQWANYQQVGSVWGLAYQKSTQSLFASATLKRNTVIGPGGLGGIYKIQTTSKQPNATTLWVDVAALGLNVGDVSSRDVGTAHTEYSHDTEAFRKIGKVGIGGLDISEDEKTLWFTNLATRQLCSLLIDADNNPSTPPSAKDLKVFDLPSGDCNGENSRIWAVKVNMGRVFVGSVCSGEGSSKNLQALVYSFDIQNNTFQKNPVFAFPLSYKKGAVEYEEGTQWNTWNDAFEVFPIFNNDAIIYPQPMLTGIEFDGDESMLLQFTDRTTYQVGYGNWGVNTSDKKTFYSTESGGDLLRASKNGSFYVLESNALAANTTTNGKNNDQGPALLQTNGYTGKGGEYYFQDQSPHGYLKETVTGGIALLPNSGELLVGVNAPLRVFSGGLARFNNKTGESPETSRYEVYDLHGSSEVNRTPGIGDVAVLCNTAPIEIGNRIWLDSNKDGLQDADEPGLDSQTIALFRKNGNDFIKIAETRSTNRGGQSGIYLFNNQNVTESIFPNTDYEIRLTLTNSLVPTVAHANSNATDEIDNDATFRNKLGVIAFRTGNAGENQYNLDFGLTVCNSQSTNTPELTVSSNSPVCQGGTLLLRATGGTAYRWSGVGGFVAEVNNPQIANFQALQAGVYTVFVSQNNACVGETSATVNVVMAEATLSISNNSPVCSGRTLSIVSSGGNSYQWEGPNGFKSNAARINIPFASARLNGIYSVTATQTNGCTATATTKAEVLQPLLSINSNSPVCAGNTLAFNAFGGTQYQWTGPNGFQSVQGNPQIQQVSTANAGQYLVSATMPNGCVVASIVSVQIREATLAISSNSPVCTGSILTLSSYGGQQYQWAGAAGFSSLSAVPQRNNVTTNMEGGYTVTATASNGCVVTASTQVVVVKSAINILSNVNVCVGAPIGLSTQPQAQTYFWTGPNGFGSSEAKPNIHNSTSNSAGVYSVSASLAQGCTASNTLKINVLNSSITASSNSPICGGQSLLLLAAGGQQYRWAGVSGFVANTANPQISNVSTANTGIYSVTATVQNGCTASATTRVVVASFAGSVSTNSPVKAGQTVLLLASGGATYAWFGPNGFQTNSASPTITLATTNATGTYSVVITNATGCKNTITTAVQVVPNSPERSGCYSLNLKVLLEGPYQTASKTMSTRLNQEGLLPGQAPKNRMALPTPEGQPYTISPWNFLATSLEQNPYTNQTVDWILVSVRSDSLSARSTIFKTAALLESSGEVRFINGCVNLNENQAYYVVVEHRNHLGAMSAGVRVQEDKLSYDFTKAESYTTRNPPSFGQKNKNGVWVLFVGDLKKNSLSQNFDINANDMTLLLYQSGLFGQYLEGDLDLNADVNATDLNILKQNMGRYSAVPR